MRLALLTAAALAALALPAATSSAQVQPAAQRPASSSSPSSPPPASAEDAEEEESEESPENAAARVSCLEDLSPEGYRRKGVQQRDFLKRLRFELSAVGGFYASDVLSSTYTAGGALAFFPAEDLGLEVLVSYTPVRFELEEPFTSFDDSRRFSSGSAINAMGGVVFSPFHAKFKFSEETIVHGDLVLVAGAGRTFHDSVQGLSYQAGLGLKLYLYRHLALRFDLRDLVLSQEVLGRGRVSHNWTVLGGLSFWL